MTRLFLAAGVAALAIATPAAAKPGNGHGNGGGQAAVQRGGGGGGGGHAQAFARGGGGGGGGPRFQAYTRGGGGGGGGFAAPRMQRPSFAMQRGQSQHFAMMRAERPQRAERQQIRPQMRMQAQNRGFERQQLRTQRMQANNHAFERQQIHAQRMQVNNRALERQQLRAQRVQQVQNRGFERQQLRAQQMQAQNRGFERQQLRAQQMQAQNRGFERQQLRMQQAQNNQQLRQQAFAREQLNGQRLAAREFNDGDRQFVRSQQLAYQRELNATRFAALNYPIRTQILAPTVVERFVGVPVTTVSSFAALSPFPAAYSYLYPSTADYYYQYGNGYAYQIDRSSNLIASLIPLLAGGYLPGQYLPQPYMASYVPDYYGFNSFYPDYGNTCNRYANGVIYQVDCYTGMVEDVIPMYAGGYGVGQMLPTSYAYYNVPYQYRTMYYDTPDYNYWYAPGAIYQYDPRSSMITSVAALLSPGFTVGQPLPMGYDVYNVPYAYRATYYDTPNAWYRYNNGYIYQVDPATQLVTAIVASLLT